MKAVFFSLALLLAPVAVAASPAPELAGDWEGELDAGEGALPVVLHVGETVTGDSPSQGVSGIPATVEREGETWRLKFETIGAVYEARLDPEGRLAGTYSQNGLAFPLTLQRKDAAADAR